MEIERMYNRLGEELSVKALLEGTPTACVDIFDAIKDSGNGSAACDKLNGLNLAGENWHVDREKGTRVRLAGNSKASQDTADNIYIECGKSKAENREISVNTPAGEIYAEISGDTAYPGIYLWTHDVAEDGQMYERQIALFEWDDTNKKLRLAVWGDKDTEDYTDNFNIKLPLPDDGTLEDAKAMILNEIGDFFGHSKKITPTEVILSNGQKEFNYKSYDEALADWLITLVENQYYDKTNWTNVIDFIVDNVGYEGVRPIKLAGVLKAYELTASGVNPNENNRFTNAYSAIVKKLKLKGKLD